MGAPIDEPPDGPGVALFDIVGVGIDIAAGPIYEPPEAPAPIDDIGSVVIGMFDPGIVGVGIVICAGPMDDEPGAPGSGIAIFAGPIVETPPRVVGVTEVALTIDCPRIVGVGIVIPDCPIGAAPGTVGSGIIIAAGPIEETPGWGDVVIEVAAPGTPGSGIAILAGPIEDPP